ncbi:MAG: MauE/DoxX family redox-associated membrane protein [Pseudomonadota bacterium]
MSPEIVQELVAVFGVAVRALLVVIFGQGLLHKLREPARFRAQLQRFEVLPLGLVFFAALLLTAAEAVLLSGLILAPLVGLPLAAALLLLYALAMGINVGRGRVDIDCGCGGTPMPVSSALVARNLVLVGLALIALGAGPASLGSAVTGLLAGGVCALMYLTLHELAQGGQAAVR